MSTIEEMGLANVEPATDVTDLDTARRLVTYLRRMVSEIGRDNEPVPGEFTAFLSSEHVKLLEWMYERKRLLAAHGPRSKYWLDPPELECEAFTDFVEEAIEMSYDMALSDEEHERNQRRKRRRAQD